MSITLDYFFNHDAALPAVAELVNATLGCSLQRYLGDPEDLFCRFLALEFTLGTHQLDDDCSCDFTRYRYQLGTRTPWADADLRGAQIGLMALVPVLLHQRARIGSGILVYDTQRLLARYRVQGEALFDELGGNLVALPQHIADIHGRIRLY